MDMRERRKTLCVCVCVCVRVCVSGGGAGERGASQPRWDLSWALILIREIPGMVSWEERISQIQAGK